MVRERPGAKQWLRRNRINGDDNPFDVFIAYRRDDTDERSHTVYQVLKARLERHGLRVFRDQQHLHGAWSDEIAQAVSQSKVMIVMLGQNWLNDVNRARLFDPEDVHRREIETFLLLRESEKGQSRRLAFFWMCGVNKPPPADELPESLRTILDETSVRDPIDLPERAQLATYSEVTERIVQALGVRTNKSHRVPGLTIAMAVLIGIGVAIVQPRHFSPSVGNQATTTIANDPSVEEIGWINVVPGSSGADGYTTFMLWPGNSMVRLSDVHLRAIARGDNHAQQRIDHDWTAASNEVGTSQIVRLRIPAWAREVEVCMSAPWIKTGIRYTVVQRFSNARRDGDSTNQYASLNDLGGRKVLPEGDASCKV